MRPTSIDPALRIRYELLPATINSAFKKRRLRVLIARTALDEHAALLLAQIALARWYCDDVRDEIDLDVSLVIPSNCTTLLAVFDRLGVGHGRVAPLDESDANAVATLALKIDADVVLAHDVGALRDKLSDDVMLVVGEPHAVLHNVEIHLKGFDLPWSFEFPTKGQPWTNFYPMCEQSVFVPLQAEWAASVVCGESVANKMRILFAQTLPALCFNRDRMEFYRQQDRWTDRNDIERQDFRFEYTNALNNFYVTLYSGVDLAVGLCSDIYGLELTREQTQANAKVFRRRRKAVPGLDAIFSDEAFWKMYTIPRLIRHQAAHSGPVTPEHIYQSDDDFTDEQLDVTAEENGLYDDMRFIERTAKLPDAVRQNMIDLARFKAKLKLMGRPLKHALVLPDGSKIRIYHPDPAAGLERFLEFFNRVLALIKPWDQPRPKLVWPTESD